MIASVDVSRRRRVRSALNFIATHQRASVVALYSLRVLTALAAGLTAFLLRFDFTVPARRATCCFWALSVWVAVKPLVLARFGAARVWRHFSTRDIVPLVVANLSCSLAASAILLVSCPVPFPRSVLLIDFLAFLFFSIWARVLVRTLVEFAAQADVAARHRTLVYGAGQAGSLVCEEARTNPRFPYDIRGFVDDVKPRGASVNGFAVLGSGLDLERLARKHRVSHILIATPSATSRQMREITACCQASGLTYKTMPSISEILADRGLARQIRDVAVEDLLGRSCVELDSAEIERKLRGNIVLVTGAGGSIGSELCRQVARHHPARLIGLDISETALFYLEQEMRELFPPVRFHAEIGSIRGIERLREIFAHFRPSLVLHAAAFKHVPLMERHLFEAVENNVFGSHHLGIVAAEYGVADFVMISSDKAVQPSSVMGATKRLAELTLRSLQNGGPRYVSVRFGNVLGSNGSVVPIFKKQIAAGGPVTVTHPEMQRYFMTIPEAAQLVLQASTMGNGGEIFVLDMGQPVRIVDLARQLIRLSGFRPGEDIKIEFTGMRPGEKLREELNLADESLLATHHHRIKVFAGASLPAEEMLSHLRRLRWACDNRDAALLLREMKTIVPDYREGRDLLRGHEFTDDVVSLAHALHARAHQAAAGQVPSRLVV